MTEGLSQSRSGGRVAIAASATGALTLLAILALPIAALVLRGGAAGLRALVDDPELRAALLLTTAMATVATISAMTLGTPLAWMLARRRVPGGALIAAVLDLPLLIPHPVAGIALLLAFGSRSVAGQGLAHIGLAVVSSPVGVALAMLFVSAPLYVAGARAVIEQVDERYESVARTLGDPAWRAAWRVTRPMAARGLAGSAIMMWTRAASEFGAIVILTYNPKVVSVLSYDRFTSDGLDGVLPVAAALVLLALVPLVALRWLRDGPRS